MFFTSQLSCTLIPLLVVAPLLAEAPAEPAASAAPVTLQIRVVESDGPSVPVNARSAKGISVLVTDGNGSAVSDAAVAFRFPDNGSSAAFRDGSHSTVAYTDGHGLAHVGDFQWNDQAGPLALRVTATKANSHAGLLLEQTLVSGSAPVIAAASAEPEPIEFVAQTVLAKPVAIPATETAAALPATPSVDVPSPSPLALGEPVAIAMNRPGALTSPASEASIAPYRGGRLGVAPAISISSTDRSATEYHDSIFANKKKWIILGVIAAVGVGAGLALMSAKSSSAASTSGVSVGTPTITIGHP